MILKNANKYFFIIILHACGPGSSVGIATDYGLDGLGIESRWGEIFCRPDWPWGPTQPPVQWVPSFPGVEKAPGHDIDPSPPSSAEV